MGLTRGCSKTGCKRPAVATLTYAYADRAVVLGPLATYAEPHTYDLCRDHAERMTAPRGWEVVRVGGEYSEPALAPVVPSPRVRSRPTRPVDSPSFEDPRPAPEARPHDLAPAPIPESAPVVEPGG